LETATGSSGWKACSRWAALTTARPPATRVGAYKAIAWTGVPLNAKFFFQLVFSRHRGDDCLGLGRGTHQIHLLHRLLVPAGFVRLSDHRPLDLGWRLARGGGFLGLFAGSTVVHSVGGWAALAGILVLGPRLGKCGPDGKVNPIPPHSYTSAVIGCFLLWLGWFGFNPGSTMAVDANAIRTSS
jgi:Amt family ammonium transporter